MQISFRISKPSDAKRLSELAEARGISSPKLARELVLKALKGATDDHSASELGSIRNELIEARKELAHIGDRTEELYTTQAADLKQLTAACRSIRKLRAKIEAGTVAAIQELNATLSVELERLKECGTNRSNDLDLRPQLEAIDESLRRLRANMATAAAAVLVEGSKFPVTEAKRLVDRLFLSDG